MSTQHIGLAIVLVACVLAMWLAHRHRGGGSEWQETASPVPDRRIGAAEIEAAIDDVGAIELPAQQRLSTVCNRIENVEIDDADLVELLGKIREGLDGSSAVNAA